MKILIIGSFKSDWHELAWSKAIQKLGHQVIEFPYHSYISEGFLGKFQNRFVIGPIVNQINKDILIISQKTQADLIVLYRSLLIQPQTLLSIKQTCNSLLVSYNNDNIFAQLKHKTYWRHFKKSIPFFDLNLVYRISDISYYSNITVKPTYQLFSHYLPWMHHKIECEKSTDVCFLGHCEPDKRIEQLDDLMRAVPASYNIRGSMWDRYGKGKAWNKQNTDEVYGTAYVKQLNQAKIALVFFSSWNADTYTRRVFEIPACGTFMLSQRSDTMLELYEEDKEAVYFDSTEELIDKARFYLKHDKLRQDIARAGYNRCINSGYDIYSRMKEWISIAEKFVIQKSQS